MKFKVILVVILILSLFTGCANETVSAPQVESGITLTDEQMEALGITQEDFDKLSEAEKEQAQALFDEMRAQENAQQTTNATEPPTTAPTEDPQAAIDPEADVQKYLELLPPLPTGERKYDYEWSERLDRISYYLITIDPASDTEVYDFMYALESEYGFMSGGKEQWDEKTNTSTYEFSTDTLFIYVDVTPNDDGTSKVTIWISYNPYI